jgi:hypothetical protein
MKRIVVLLLAALACSTPVFAQIALPTVPTTFKVSVDSQSSQAPAERTRGGFTILVNLGFGVQNDTYVDESAGGLAGANLGIGGFVNPKLAVLGRFSGTNVNYDLFGQVSGVVGATLQYWATDRFIVEGGAGIGYWTAEGDSETGFGLIVGASGVVFNRGKHNLLVGVEYAPAFTDSGTVHNLGFTFGYQFHKR